jgi:hypothetical protein
MTAHMLLIFTEKLSTIRLLLLTFWQAFEVGDNDGADRQYRLPVQVLPGT